MTDDRSAVIMEGEYVPPLPEIILRTLEKTLFCYLATCENNEPHLSLMNFSFKEEDGIVMSTRCNTKKFQALLANPSVAVLVHDFQSTSSLSASVIPKSTSSSTSPAQATTSSSSSSTTTTTTAISTTAVAGTSTVGGTTHANTDHTHANTTHTDTNTNNAHTNTAHTNTAPAPATNIQSCQAVGSGSGSVSVSTVGSCSITVYGNIEVLSGEKAEELRAFHLSKNPSYPQFIVGDDIAIIRIFPTRARICDIRDKVLDWKIES